MSKKHSIFISYRRNESKSIAEKIFNSLQSNGFDVFIDKELGLGKWSPNILNEIAKRECFIVILAPKTLERCSDPNDMVRREIEMAIDLARNIIPLFDNGFSFDDQSDLLVGKLIELKEHNGIPISHEFYKQFIAQLTTKFLIDTSFEGDQPHPIISNEKLQQPLVAKNDVLSDEEQQILYRAKEKTDAQDYDGAIEILSKAIDSNPNFAWAYSSRGASWRWKGEIGRAFADYNKAIELNPEVADFYYNRGLAYYHIELYDSAIEDFWRAIQKDPSYTPAYQWSGFSYYHLKDYESGIKSYNIAIHLAPILGDSYANRGLIFIEIEDYITAISDYTEAIKWRSPDLHLVYVNRAWCFMKIKEFERAIFDLNKAIEIDPDFARAWEYLGRVYTDLNRVNEAYTAYSKAIEIDEKYAGAYVNRGWLLYEQGEFDKALDDNNKAIQINQQFAEAFNNRGLIFLNRSEFELAFKDFTSAIEYKHERLEIPYTNRSRIQKNVDDKLEDLAKAIEINPNHAIAYSYRIDVYRELGNMEAELVDLKTLLSLINGQNAEYREKIESGIHYLETRLKK